MNPAAAAAACVLGSLVVAGLIATMDMVSGADWRDGRRAGFAAARQALRDLRVRRISIAAALRLLDRAEKDDP